MEESHQSLLTLNEGCFCGNKEVEGYTLECDWDSHTINRKWSGQVGIDHHNGGLPGHKGYIWGEGDFPEAAGDGVGE